MGFLNVLNQMIDAKVIKAHAVDQPFGFNQAKQTWLVISRLRTRRYRPDFDRAKAHRTECINAFAIFVQTGRQAQWIFESQAHALNWFFRHVLTHQRGQRRSCNTA